MSKRKDMHVWLGVGLLLAIILLTTAFFISTLQRTTTLRLGDGVFRVRIASFDAEQRKGLGGVTKLGQEEGMLFMYENEGDYKIWMKDMKIPIDAVWLNSDRKVMHIETGLQPDSYPKQYGPASRSQYILELSEGAVQRARIKTGQQMVYEDHRMSW